MNINEVIRIAQKEWMNVPGVLGVGISKKGECDVILVVIENYTSLIKSSIPSKFYGYEVVFYKSDPITIQIM